MITRSLLLPSFALGLALGACNGGDPPTIDSGIDGEKQGSDLTPAEQAQLCEAVASYGAEVLPAEDAKRAGCTLTAVAFALLADGSENTCNTLRDECLTEPAMPGPDTCDLKIDWATCMATIAEIEACYEEQAQTYAEFMRSVSCAKMAEYASGAPTMDAALGTACSSAKAKCPTIAG